MSTNAGHPAWVIAAAECYVGDRINESTAIGISSKGVSSTSKGLSSLQASFFRNRPPQPSKLWVHCPEAEAVETPRVLCIAGDLILFTLAVSSGVLPGRDLPLFLNNDYFVYRADPNRPQLTLLPHDDLPHNDLPEAYLREGEVGILPRGLHDYTIAVLVHGYNKLELQLFHSETLSWTCMKMSVESPQQDFPVKIPCNVGDLRYHDTTNVITIGGERGTMGWVDLWRGILFCDVLSEKPTLRGVPLPLPMRHIRGGGDGKGFYLCRAMDIRGIAFVNGCLEFVELDIFGTYLPDIQDPDTRYPTLLVTDWTISTWKNRRMSNSYDDWGNAECTVRASEVTIKSDMISHPSGMLMLPSEEGTPETPEAELVWFPNLVVSDPLPSLDGDGVVYLTARVKLWHKRSWIIAVDMNSKTLQSVAPFGIVEDPFGSVMYCTSR